MANKLDAQERTRRTILKAEGKEVQELEAINKFHEGIMRRKVIIQKLFERSVANQIYTFPRKGSVDVSSGSQDVEGNQLYDLRGQNKKDKSHQTNPVHMHLKSASTTDLVRSIHKRKREDLRKQKNNQSNYSSKPRKNDERTLLNSSRKGVAEQFSLGQINCIHTKKGSQNIVISFRGKKQGVNVSVSRKRINTDL